MLTALNIVHQVLVVQYLFPYIAIGYAKVFTMTVSFPYIYLMALGHQ